MNLLRDIRVDIADEFSVKFFDMFLFHENFTSQSNEIIYTGTGSHHCFNVRLFDFNWCTAGI